MEQFRNLGLEEYRLENVIVYIKKFSDDSINYQKQYNTFTFLPDLL